MPRLATGFITIHRELLESELGKEPTGLMVFLHLIAWANIRETTIKWHGKPRKCPRGSLVLSLRSFAEHLGINKDTAAEWLIYLKDRETITLEAVPGQGTFITINNYDAYQAGGKHTRKRKKSLSEIPGQRCPDESDKYPDKYPDNKNKVNEVEEVGATAPAINSSLVQEFAMRGEDCEAVVSLMVQVLGPGQSKRTLKMLAPRVLAHFETPLAFKYWVDELWNSPGAAEKGPRWIMGAILREVGMRGAS